MSTTNKFLLMMTTGLLILSIYLYFQLQDTKDTKQKMLAEVISIKNNSDSLMSQITDITTEKDSLKKTLEQLLIKVNTPTYTPPYIQITNTTGHINRFIPDIIPIVDEYAISQNYDTLHQAVDLATNKENTIVAAAAGVVIARYDDINLGNVILIDHLNSYKTLYAHIHEFKVNLKEFAEKGQEIATIGNTGNSTHYHLHFQIYFQNEPIDPNTMMNIAVYKN